MSELAAENTQSFWQCSSREMSGPTPQALSMPARLGWRAPTEDSVHTFTHTSSLALNVKNLGNSLCRKKSKQEAIKSSKTLTPSSAYFVIIKDDLFYFQNEFSRKAVLETHCFYPTLENKYQIPGPEAWRREKTMN